MCPCDTVRTKPDKWPDAPQMQFESFIPFLDPVCGLLSVCVKQLLSCDLLCSRPSVCAISSLGYDHMEVLGDTLEKIAWQKGGIYKPNCPAFTAPQFPSPMRVLAERAEEVKVRLYIGTEQYRESNVQ